MTYIDDNQSRNCPEFLALLHDSIASGFLTIKATDYTRLDCSYLAACKTCPFAFRNSKFGCPSGDVTNHALVDYVTSYYPEYFL